MPHHTVTAFRDVNKYGSGSKSVKQVKKRQQNQRRRQGLCERDICDSRGPLMRRRERPIVTSRSRSKGRRIKGNSSGSMWRDGPVRLGRRLANRAIVRQAVLLWGRDSAFFQTTKKSAACSGSSGTHSSPGRGPNAQPRKEACAKGTTYSRDNSCAPKSLWRCLGLTYPEAARAAFLSWCWMSDQPNRPDHTHGPEHWRFRVFFKD